MRGSRVVPFVFAILTAAVPPGARAQLRLIRFGADTSAYDVGSILVMGPTEAVLVDAQFHMSDARREADSLVALGAHLKAIFITHPDEDHYFGLEAILARFPGTPVYMTPRSIWEYNRSARGFLEGARRNEPAEAPDSLIRPTVLPADALIVDGQRLEIVPDLQGDVLAPSNSFVWIPSLRAAVVGDLVFNHVHPWLAASDRAARRDWRRALQRIASYHPARVLASHAAPGASEGPETISAMDHYLADYDDARHLAPDADSLVAVMRRKYPDYAVGQLLVYSARTAYRLWVRD